jgi:uncharacterized membrane protein
MASHEHSVVVERPITTVYHEWTQFEKYPAFMDNVEEVRVLDDDLTHWTVSIAGVQREYDAKILEQRDGDVIAWESVTGPEQAGRVSFAMMEPERTRVTLRLDFQPHGITEKAAEAVGVVESSVTGSLERFKDYIEGRVVTGDADGPRVDGPRSPGRENVDRYGHGPGPVG